MAGVVLRRLRRIEAGHVVSCDFEPSVLKSVMEELDKIDRTRFGEKDLIGRVYEYYLQAFSINADKEEGEFYTPRSLVELIATMIEPGSSCKCDTWGLPRAAA